MDSIVRQGLILGGAGLVSAIAYAIELWWWSPVRRRVRARKWAQRCVTSYEDEWLIPFEDLGVLNRRIGCLGLVLFLVVFVEIPTGGQPYAAWLYSLPPLLAILYGLSGTRMSLPPGTRVARLRELELTDYLPERMRLFMWFAGAVGCLACVLVGVASGGWSFGVSGALMIVAPASVELATRRLARLPEPGQSPAHLYLQDVLRADQVRWAALSSALSAAMLCNWLSSASVGSDGLWRTLMAMNGVLLAGVYLVGLRPWKASTYMASRLWPQIPRGQRFSDADRLPTRTA